MTAAQEQQIAAPANALQPFLTSANTLARQLWHSAQKARADIDFHATRFGARLLVGARRHLTPKNAVRQSGRLTSFVLRTVLIPGRYDTAVGTGNIVPKSWRVVATAAHGFGLMFCAASAVAIAASRDIDATSQIPVESCVARSSAALAQHKGRYAELTRLTGTQVTVPLSVHLAVAEACGDNYFRTDAAVQAVQNGSLPAVREWAGDYDNRLAEARTRDAQRRVDNAAITAQLEQIRLEMPERRARALERQRAVLIQHSIRRVPEPGSTAASGS